MKSSLNPEKEKLKIFIGITGASGAIYAEELLKSLKNHEIYLSSSKWGERIIQLELGKTVEELKPYAKEYFSNNDLTAPPASGSFKLDAVIVAPCSMSTIACAAGGYTPNLITRVIDVSLKQRRKVVLVPRETPLNQIHLENMLKLSRAGAVILPASPGFYHQPKTIKDLVKFIVGKVLDILEIEHELYKHWGIQRT